jgi:hypothetical protein
VAPVHAWDAMRVEREVAAFSAEVDRMFRIQG